MSTHHRIAIAAAVLAAGAVPAIALGQSAPPSVHLVATQTSAVVPKRLKPADTLVFAQSVTGDDHGTGATVCTFAGAPGLVCTVQLQLAKGTLSVQGTLPERARNTPLAVTGGTGAYAGARGTALVTDKRAKTTDVAITLLS